MIPENTPLGLSFRYDSDKNVTEVSWCYLQNANIEYFVLEYWDDDERKFKPFDGQYGIIRRENI